MMGGKRRCAHCGEPTAWEGNPFRPFCSERCQLSDLGNWLGERYRVPGDAIETAEPERDDTDADE